ncbi:MAG: tRNA lysidine(34) synthetase TilS [Candidatus Omnitrophica bacterium]|nr:tRNA lysidine(34) synthetase TilS [Candidatus Omnitrophota bacterium]
MDPLLLKVRDAVAAHRLIRPRDRVLVGVSGGPDSVALLHVLAGLRATLGMALAVVHVDHQLRPDSADDAAFVEALARRWQVPATILRRDVRAETSGQGRSLEDAARRVRYDAFLDAARLHSATRLTLAHTADDQAETVLMRLLRGSGLTGLSAIPITRSLEDVTVVRPLLGIWRTEVLAYLARHRLAFREDATNRDPRFLRNRIRRELLPLLEQAYNPQIKLLLGQLAEQCRTDMGFLQTAAQRHWKRLVKASNGSLAIRIEAFLQQPSALQRQLIRMALERLQGDLAGFEFRHWREIERLFTTRPVGTLLDLPGRAQLERGRERVIVRLV